MGYSLKCGIYFLTICCRNKQVNLCYLKVHSQRPARFAKLFAITIVLTKIKCFANLLPIAEISVEAKSRAWDYARILVENIRIDQVGKGGVDALLK